MYLGIHKNLFHIRDSERKPASCSFLFRALSATVTVLPDNVMFYLTLRLLCLHIVEMKTFLASLKIFIDL